MIDDQDGQALRCDALEQLMQFEFSLEFNPAAGSSSKSKVGLAASARRSRSGLMAIRKARNQFVGRLPSDKVSADIARSVSASTPLLRAAYCPPFGRPITTFSSAVMTEQPMF